MQRTVFRPISVLVVILLVVVMMTSPSVFAQSIPNSKDAAEAQYQEKVRQALESGQSEALALLGDIGADLVYTPVDPCRIVDTRNAGGPIAGFTSRSFDVDAPDVPWFTGQGGNNGPCGIPFDVTRAVAMNVTVTQPDNFGYVTVWAVGSPQPLASVLNFNPGQTIPNFIIAPVEPGVGNDFNVFVALGTTHIIVDVMGYFAPPVATPLDCTDAASGFVAVAVNSWTTVDANCPAEYTATGGGHFTNEGTLGYPGVWTLSVPNGNGWRIWVDNQTDGPRNVQAWARCCRVLGR
jgi:hypothetical protein